MDANTEYELFTQIVIQLFSRNGLFKSNPVRHNVKLKGKSGQNHQVDVYWE